MYILKERNYIKLQAETLRDSFPPSDKSLSRLLGEAPYLPNSIFSLLESLCSPGNIDKAEELQSGDRVTQGLSTVWSLILLRPPIRESCLKIALQVSSLYHRFHSFQLSISFAHFDCHAFLGLFASCCEGYCKLKCCIAMLQK